jgi:hypothetical protein
MKKVVQKPKQRAYSRPALKKYGKLRWFTQGSVGTISDGLGTHSKKSTSSNTSMR